MSDWDNIFQCPICGAESVPPHNPNNSNVLIVGEFPGKTELERGIPLVGRTGELLRQELAYLGYGIGSFGLCNLWQHPPNKNEECLMHGKQVVIRESEDKEIILLVGSDVAKMFLTKGISELNGLNVKEFLRFEFSAPVVMAMVNPAIMFHSVAGEVKLALKKFIREVEKLDE